jgi:hypothetical protein
MGVTGTAGTAWDDRDEGAADAAVDASHSDVAATDGAACHSAAAKAAATAAEAAAAAAAAEAAGVSGLRSKHRNRKRRCRGESEDRFA